jgi:hypothetical protein
VAASPEPHLEGRSTVPVVSLLQRSSRALAAIAAVALLAAACGDDGGDEAAGSEPQVIRVQGSDAGAAELDSAATESRVASDSMLAAAIEYTLADGLPALDDPAASWYYPADTPVGVDAVRALAAALDLAGDPEPVSADLGGGWSVGPSDGSGPSLTVSGDPMGSWWFSPSFVTTTCAVAEPAPAQTTDTAVAGEVPPAESSVDDDPVGDDPVDDDPVDDSAVAADPAAPETGVAEQGPASGGGVDPVDATQAACDPGPPAGVPDSDAARALAEDAFARWGMDLARYELEVYADEWSASVTAVLVLDGVRTPVTASVAFGGDAAVVWAGGTLAEPVRGPDYPRIGTAAGFERLQAEAERWQTLAATGGPEVLVDEATGAETAGAATGAPDVASCAPPVDPAVDPAVADAPVCAPIDVEPLVVHLTGVRAELQMLWDVDGTVWLVPAYGFTSDDGGVHVVAAIADEWIAEPEPSDDTPDTPDTAPPVDTVVAEPGSDPDAPVSSPGSTPTTSPLEAEPVEVQPEQAARLVGLTEADAGAAAAERGWTFRVVERDGESFAATDDFRTDRVNVVVDGGVVTSVTIG